MKLTTINEKRKILKGGRKMNEENLLRCFTDEQLEIIKNNIDRIVEVVKKLVNSIVKEIHYIIDNIKTILNTDMNLYKKKKKGKRYVYMSEKIKLWKILNKIKK